MQYMNIVVSVNKSYITPLKVMLTSLMRFHDIKLWILNMEGLEKADYKPLFLTISEENVHIIEMPHKLENETRFSPSSLSRLFIPFLLSNEERALYLDADLIIRKPIDSFYNLDFNGKGIIGVADFYLGDAGAYKRMLGLESDDNYINSGVLLMDLEYLRKNYNYETVMDAFNKYVPCTDFIDQDFINVFFQKDILITSGIYNYPPFSHEYKEPHILHFFGPKKPWHATYASHYFFEYKKIWKQTTGQNLSTLKYIRSLIKSKIIDRILASGDEAC